MNLKVCVNCHFTIELDGRRDRSGFYFLKICSNDIVRLVLLCAEFLFVLDLVYLFHCRRKDVF